VSSKKEKQRQVNRTNIYHDLTGSLSRPPTSIEPTDLLHPARPSATTTHTAVVHTSASCCTDRWVIMQ